MKVHSGRSNPLDPELFPKRRVTIIGAGITGLSAGFRLQQLLGTRVDITVLETSSTPGGVIGTSVLGNSIVESGPESFSTIKPGMMELCKDLGISDKLINSDTRNASTLVADGSRLTRLPPGFIMFAPASLLQMALSPFFSLGGKIRMAMDLFTPPLQVADESIAQFVRRRLGDEALTKVAEPLLSGIFGGHTDTLSAKSTIPQMVMLEQRYGSVIRGLWHQQKHRPSGKQTPSNYSAMASFDEGLDVIIRKLMQSLPAGTLKTNRRVIAVSREEGLWQVQTANGEPYISDGLILACPATAAAAILKDFDPQLSALLSSIEYSAAVVYNFLFPRQSINEKLDAFGFVVPENQRKSIKACSFSSVKFPGRTPADLVLLRVFASGESSQSRSSQAQILQELGQYLQIDGEPILTDMRYHQPAVPKYAVGHSRIVSEIESITGSIRGLALAGNAYHGMGLPDCVLSANSAAHAIAQYLTVDHPLAG